VKRTTRRPQPSAPEAVAGLLASTLSSLADAVIVTDAGGIVRFLNPAAQRLTGWEGDEAIGHPLDLVARIVDHSSGDFLESPVPKVVREGAVLAPQFKMILLSRDGRSIPIEESASPVRTAGDDIEGVVVTLRDLTARQNASEAQLSLASIVEFSDDAIIGADMAGAIRSWNAAATRIFGYSASEMIGRPTALLFPPGSAGDSRDGLERIRRGECVRRHETKVQTKTGRTIDIELTISPISDTSGRIVGSSRIAHDITGRKRAEHALRASEERFRMLFDSNIVAIAFWDSRDLITEANDAYLSLIGYRRDEFEPGRINWRDQTPPEYQALDDLALEEAHASSLSRVYEKEVTRRDGKRISVSIRVAELNSATPQGLVFAADISERRQVQKQLLRSQKLESLSVLAGGIAHDFNNLLMGIIANVSLMIDDAPENSPLAELGENVLAATDQAAHLTRQMLAYSGRGQFAVQSVSLTTQVEAISALIRASIPKGVRLNLNLSRNLPRIRADASQIQQLVMNLALNGAEAIGVEGVLTISASTREVREDDHRGNLAGAPLSAGPYVVLQVQDNGAGMDEVTQAKMFDPFFSTKFTGRGLGLAAVLGIVRGHRGGIAVSSEPRKGTVFQVLFPVLNEGADAPRQQAERALSR
jgi:PAS domain S-box-containing protein